MAVVVPDASLVLEYDPHEFGGLTGNYIVMRTCGNIAYVHPILVPPQPRHKCTGEAPVVQSTNSLCPLGYNTVISNTSSCIILSYTTYVLCCEATLWVAV